MGDLRVKICGITTREAAQVAVESGAAMIGLVFYPPSPRFLTPVAADALIAALDRLENQPLRVGLFVNVPTDELALAVERYRLDYLQLSGDETVEQVKEASQITPVIKTIRQADQGAIFGDLDNLTLLLDTHKAGMYGGTGQVGNWQAARELARYYRVLLAGGLTPDNVAEAVEIVQPWGVDVSSGVEDTPGHKDLSKIRQFCHNALGKS